MVTRSDKCYRMIPMGRSRISDGQAAAARSMTGSVGTLSVAKYGGHPADQIQPTSVAASEQRYMTLIGAGTVGGEDRALTFTGKRN